MSRLASLQTTQARWEADDAAREWKEHRQHCPGCDLASRRRQWGSLCRKGAGLRSAKLSTAVELDRNRVADRQPSPDQEPLFS